MPTVTVGSPVFFVGISPSPALRKPLPNPPQGRALKKSPIPCK